MAAVPVPVTLPTKTHEVLYSGLTSFARTFLITFLSFGVGILGAPNKNTAISLALAALAASLAAGLRVIQVFFPMISFAKLLPQPWAAYLDSIVRTFLAVFVATATNWLGSTPNWSTWHSALNAALLGAGAAVIRALQGAVTPTEVPFVNTPPSVPTTVVAAAPPVTPAPPATP
jgi:hypothetical protein